MKDELLHIVSPASVHSPPVCSSVIIASFLFVISESQGEVPTVRIQAGTPVPAAKAALVLPAIHQQSNAGTQPYKQTDKPNGLNGLNHIVKKGKLLHEVSSFSWILQFNYPLLSEPLSNQNVPTGNNQPHIRPHPPNKNPVQASFPSDLKNDVFKKPSVSSLSNHQNLYSSHGNLKLPDHLNATYSPTPSDISSIRMTPHYSVLTPTLEQRNGIGTPRTPHSDRGQNFLEPSVPPSKVDWHAYKVLPGVNATNAHSQENCSDQQPGSALSQYPISNMSLSPFPPFDFSPAPSIFSSPRHSARSHRKRPLSISPLSGDGIDLNAIIRISPTSLAAYGGGSSRASSASRSRLSPFTNNSLHPMGNQGHLNPRNVISQQHNIKVKDELSHIEHAQMAQLESQGHNPHQMPPNHVVMPQQNVYMAEGYALHKNHQYTVPQHQLHPSHYDYHTAALPHHAMPYHGHTMVQVPQQYNNQGHHQHNQGHHQHHQGHHQHNQGHYQHNQGHHQQLASPHQHHQQVHSGHLPMGTSGMEVHFNHQSQIPPIHPSHHGSAMPMKSESISHHHHHENLIYHPEQQMPQLSARPPPLPRVGVSAPSHLRVTLN